MPELRRLELTGPLEDGVLQCSRLTATEELGRLFEIELDLYSSSESINFDDVLGRALTVCASLSPRESRYFSGHVCRFVQEPGSGNYSRYRATLRPWLWFLTRTADCRIFQQKSVPDIIKEVFREHGFSGEFEEKLSGTYRTWDYCVQYRETDFNFVSRLMEQEGIYYYFTHGDGKHTLVLSDAYGSHAALPNLAEIPFIPPSDNAIRERHIYHWSIGRGLQPGAVALNDYDFEKPRADLATVESVSRNHAQSDYEVYDYPGEYREAAEGKTYAQVRIEELQSQHEQLQGEGSVLGLATGGLFRLRGHPRDDQNREYLVIRAEHELEGEARETGTEAGGGTGYTCVFTVTDARQPFRPQRSTPKPVVQGPQTAVVVGKQGEEIWTDKYGRIKVQFHWDRQGKMDENSSCWVRVAQIWAGKNWGGMHLPRVGQEVIVEFLEGDPDRPIVTGRVYNADQMPPYPLPSNATRSGVLTRSSKQGGPDHANEIRFEDKKGEEHLLIHAEKDRGVEVEQNETYRVGKDREKTIEGKEAIAVKEDREATVDGNDSLKVGKQFTLEAGDKLTLKCQGNEIVLDSSGVKITSSGKVEVSGATDVKVEGLNVDVAATAAATVKGTASAELSASGSTTVKGAMVMIN